MSKRYPETKFILNPLLVKIGGYDFIEVRFLIFLSLIADKLD